MRVFSPCRSHYISHENNLIELYIPNGHYIFVRQRSVWAFAVRVEADASQTRCLKRQVAQSGPQGRPRCKLQISGTTSVECVIV